MAIPAPKTANMKTALARYHLDCVRMGDSVQEEV